MKVTKLVTEIPGNKLIMSLTWIIKLELFGEAAFTAAPTLVLYSCNVERFSSCVERSVSFTRYAYGTLWTGGREGEALEGGETGSFGTMTPKSELIDECKLTHSQFNGLAGPRRLD